MNRFITFILFLTQLNLSAQFTWITDCSDKTFCFNQGTCDEGHVSIAEKAVTACLNGPIINYSYRIDLFNDGSTDITSSVDTVSANFPAGTHKISWKATDNCGDVINCTYLFTIEDCQPPNLICLNSITQNVTPGCIAVSNPQDYIVNTSDNCIPNDELIFGIRIEGDGLGFPSDTSLTFDGCDYGPHAIEIWVKDNNDLTNKCFSSVTIQDNDDICGCSAALTLQGCARASVDSVMLGDYTMQAELNTVPPSTPQYIQEDVLDSCYTATFTGLTLNTDYQAVVRASRTDNPLNGVSTFDLLQTSKHILNIEPFKNAYQRIAADVNASNSVTTFDIVETRRLILGLYDTFPKVPSWRFVQPIADPSNVLSAVKDTYQITLTNLTADTSISGLDFVGVKMGDTNQSASFTNNNVDDRAPLLLRADDHFFSPGETATIPVRLAEAATLRGWQIAFSIDPDLARIEGLEGLPAEDFYQSNNEIRALWFDAAGKKYERNEVLVYLKIKALQSVSLSRALSLATHEFSSEAYTPDENGAEARHSLVLGFGNSQQKGATFFPPCPNPFGNIATFGFLMDQPGEVRLEMYDLSGKMVFEQKTAFDTGYQSIVVQAADLPADGVFLYRVRVKGEVFSGRLVRG